MSNCLFENTFLPRSPGFYSSHSRLFGEYSYLSVLAHHPLLKPNASSKNLSSAVTAAFIVFANRNCLCLFDRIYFIESTMKELRQ